MPNIKDSFNDITNSTVTINNYNNHLSSFGHALYYPYIHLTNKDWLKHAFLFWDKISRIVPISFETQDSEDVLQLRKETNFIQDYHPDKQVIQETFYEFTNIIDEYLKYKDIFKENLNHRNFYDSAHKYKYLFEETDYQMIENSGYIHIEKMEPRLIKKLCKLGLAISGNGESSSWIKIDNEIGSLYMTHLAKTISNEQSIPVVTDKEDFLNLNVIKKTYENSFEENLGYLLIDSIVPKNINTVPIKQLIEIRIKYDDQRMKFFDEINKLSNTLPSIDNKSVLTDALHYYNKRLNKQTKELKKIFKGNGIDSIIKPMAVSMGVSMATEYMIPTENKWLGFSTGLLYGAITSYNSIQESKIEANKHPMSYLLNIESELNKKNLFQKIKNLYQPYI